MDRATAKIDSLIAKKERLIELLEEKRGALITRAVTRGLNPDAPLRDSDIDWLGQVPKHWEVVRNKVVFRERDERSSEGNEELLTVSHITGVTPRSEKDVHMIMAESHEGYKLCHPGDLVINTMWAWMGALGVAFQEGMVSPSYNVYRYNPARLLPRFLDYLCRTPSYVCGITSYSKGIWTSRLRLYPESFLQLQTAIPPVDEQVQVVEFLDAESAKLKFVISAITRAVEALIEYRIALITTAVTGKIDLRDPAQSVGSTNARAASTLPA